MILKFKVQESIFINFVKRKESKKHRKTLIHVYTNWKQTASLIDTETVLSSGISIGVTEDGPKTSNAVVKLNWLQIFTNPYFQ